MMTFHSDPTIKADILRGIDSYVPDPLDICAPIIMLDTVGSADWPEQLGLPIWLAYAELAFVGSMPEADQLAWTRQFIEALPVGISDVVLEREVLAPFIVAVLRRSLTTFDSANSPTVRLAVKSAIWLWGRDDIRSADWLAAHAAIGEAAWSGVSPCPVTQHGKPMPGQEEIHATFQASMLTAAVMAQTDGVDDLATVAMNGALEHTSHADDPALAGELLKILRGVAPRDRNDGMLAAVRAAG